MRARLALIALPLLAACAAEAPEPEPAGSALYPGVDVEGIAACAREAANEDERAILGSGGSQATSMMAALLGRPETAACLDARGIDLSAIAE